MRKIILSLIVVFSLFSCEDSLDRNPNDSLISDTAYRTVDDLQLGLNGVFGSYSNTSIITFNSIFTDECKIGVDNGGQQVQLYNQVLNPTTGAANNIWVGRYSVINKACRIIAAASAITPTADQQAQYDNIIGQCYAIRALCHLDLLNHYTEDPTDLNSLAVPYTDFVLSTSDFLPRNTVAEVRDKILDDLVVAEGLINNSDIYFATDNFITAVRAKVLFLTGDYDNAITYCDDLINAIPLTTAASYSAMFDDSSDDEMIFKRLRTNAEAFIGGVWYFTGTGGAFMEMSNKVYNSLDPNDARFNVLVDTGLTDPANNLHYIGKYPGKGGVNYFNDEKILRVAEFYLIKAECQALSTTYTYADSYGTLNTLRSSRYNVAPAPISYNNDVDAANAILNERVFELGYEGHRYVDLKRLRNVVNYGIVRDGADCGGASPCTLGVTDNRFTLPIPQAEMDTNPNMVQNDY